jgi:hypothetical protein
MASKAENLKFLAICAVILFVACTIIGFQLHAQLACEAIGGIPVRALSFPSFVQCVN